MIIIKIGATNPIAAKASVPNPAIQILSMILFILISNNANIIGSASLINAFFGSPLKISIFSLSFNGISS